MQKAFIEIHPTRSGYLTLEPVTEQLQGGELGCVSRGLGEGTERESPDTVDPGWSPHLRDRRKHGVRTRAREGGRGGAGESALGCSRQAVGAPEWPLTALVRGDGTVLEAIRHGDERLEADLVFINDIFTKFSDFFFFKSRRVNRKRNFKMEKM